MKILEIYQSDGYNPKKVASTNLGEWAGPCPACGGEDRFRVWPEKDKFWCRGCNKKGDAIQYLRDFKSMSYQEACAYLGKEPKQRQFTSRSIRPVLTGWKPKDTGAPPVTWQEKAKSFLDQSVDCLFSQQGAPIRKWLNTEKGISDETIKKVSLGLNMTDLYFTHSAWGLHEEKNQQVNEKKIWLSRGTVIPCLIDDSVHRLRVRRAKSGDGPRYVIVSGSSSAPMIIGQGKSVIVVESELDGILLNQDVGDLCGVVALGSAQAKPDARADRILQTAEKILLSLDADEAGGKASWTFWRDTYGDKVRRWPCIQGKDPSEARLNGLNLRDWLQAGLL